MKVKVESNVIYMRQVNALEGTLCKGGWLPKAIDRVYLQEKAALKYGS
jgi:hypothetical protein